MSSSPQNQDRLVAEINRLEADAELLLAQAQELRKLLRGAPSDSTALYGAQNIRQCIRIVVGMFSREKIWTVDVLRLELLRHGRKYSHAYVAEAMGRLLANHYVGLGRACKYRWDPPFLNRIAAGKYQRRVST